MPIDCRTETPGGFRHVLQIDAHTLATDVGPALGGGDTAPGAHEYFGASLAACKALTAMWYAKRQGYALERVEVHVEADDTREREGTYVLKVKLGFFGPLSDEEKEKVHAAVARCPVHKLMTTTTVEIETIPM